MELERRRTAAVLRRSCRHPEIIGIVIRVIDVRPAPVHLPRWARAAFPASVLFPPAPRDCTPSGLPGGPKIAAGIRPTPGPKL
jgi:hypothetical protein